jgi:UDPglucose 6-dehydrogenase
MKVAVTGLWHLGCVTAACLAKAGHDVLAYDPNHETIVELQQGKAPLYEPHLDDLIAQHITSKKLIFSANLDDLSQAEIVWVTFDTPVDDNDIADVAFVTHEIKKTFSHLKKNALVLLSSQIPVGTTRQLQEHCTEKFPEKNITFACSPENLRLGKAIEVFTKPDRIIVGLQTETDKTRIQQLLAPFSQNIIWMSIESAEMTKHALNAFLATSVVFINELSTLCERVGADAREVEMGLKSEERIGPKAYLRPGNAIAGGTLARDVNYLIQIGQQQTLKTPLFSALLDSNDAHKQWSCRRIIDTLKDLKNKTIVTLGLTYKVGTDTLRRSTAIETCEWLNQQGASVVAYDPSLTQLPAELNQFIHLKKTLAEALENADAIIISTEWPEFMALTADAFLAKVKQPFVFDAAGFLAKNLSGDSRIRYFSVGRQT